MKSLIPTTYTPLLVDLKARVRATWVRVVNLSLVHTASSASI